jgi:hypothetical protein
MYLWVEGVESTNNAAERSIRPAVLWRKRCFAHLSEGGRAFVERILKVAGSLRQQGRKDLEYLEEVLRAFAEGRETPPMVRPSPQEPPGDECVSSACLLSDPHIASLVV